MDERVAKCLDSIGEAFKELILSAKTEMEIFGLVTSVAGEIPQVAERWMEKGFEERKKEEK